MTFGAKLKLLRQEMNLTRREVSEQSGIGVATYASYEDDRRKPTRSPENYDKLAAVFGCTREYLMDDTLGAPEAAEKPVAKKPTRSKANKPEKTAPPAVPEPAKDAAPAQIPPSPAEPYIELQYGGKSVALTDVVKTARAQAGAGLTDLYIKPEENTVYYVAGAETGSFEL